MLTIVACICRHNAMRNRPFVTLTETSRSRSRSRSSPRATILTEWTSIAPRILQLDCVGALFSKALASAMIPSLRIHLHLALLGFCVPVADPVLYMWLGLSRITARFRWVVVSQAGPVKTRCYELFPTRPSRDEYCSLSRGLSWWCMAEHALTTLVPSMGLVHRMRKPKRRARPGSRAVRALIEPRVYSFILFSSALTSSTLIGTLRPSHFNFSWTA
jgi:hypothetical protein